MTIPDSERDLWRKYLKVTGLSPSHIVGYSDILHILLGPELLPLVKQIINERENA